MDRCDVLEDWGDNETDGYHWESTSSWSPLKVMLTGDYTTSSWLVKWNVDNWTNSPILLKASIVEVSGAVLVKLFL
jgi:hypothetical protein